MDKFNKILFLIFILLSGFTSTFGKVGVGILGRLTISDIFGGAYLIIFTFTNFNKRISIPAIAKVYFLVLLFYTLGLFFSLNKTQTMIELAIHYYLVILFIASYNTFKNNEDNLYMLFFVISTALMIVSLVGLYDMIAKFSGLPVIRKYSLFYPCAVSTFRNCGQAGAFAIIFLFILIGLRLSKLWEKINKKTRLLHSFAIVSGTFFLLLTVKVASYIGFIVGMILLLIFNLKNFNRIVLRLGILSIISLLLIYFSFRTPIFLPWQKWFSGKLKLRFGEILNPDKYEKRGFLRRNWEMAIDEFTMRPFFGTGLGGFSDVISKYEIHSTPLKLLGEGGIFAFWAYLIFLVFLINRRFIKVTRSTVYGDFLKKLFPLFLGLIVNWIYTYHLRKREFWILLLIIELAYKFHKERLRRVSNGKIVNILTRFR